MLAPRDVQSRPKSERSPSRTARTKTPTTDTEQSRREGGSNRTESSKAVTKDREETRNSREPDGRPSKPDSSLGSRSVSKAEGKSSSTQRERGNSAVEDVGSSDGSKERRTASDRTGSSRVRDPSSGTKATERTKRKARERKVKRKRAQEIARLAALCASCASQPFKAQMKLIIDIVPLLLVIPVSLLLALTKILLTPLYNSIPLSLYTLPLFAFYTVISSLVYWYLTLRRPAKEIISARICVCVAALGADLVSISGRSTGSKLGRLLSGRLGAVFSQGVLGLAIVGGSTVFALLCFVSMRTPIMGVDHADGRTIC